MREAGSGNERVIEVRSLEGTDAERCDAILATLPYHFGDLDGQRACAEAVRTQSGVVAMVDGVVRGFLTLHGQFPESLEITWMAVEQDARREGIGGRLIAAAAERAASAGASMLYVLTLGPSEPEPRTEDNYEGTRRFYRQHGFVPLGELGLRDWNNAHALILVRSLR